jgi:hypothetical protein
MKQNFTDNLLVLLEDSLSSREIASFITFENSHLVAESLKDFDPTIARALYNELSYWADNNQI